MQQTLTFNYFWKVDAKNRTFGNNISFLQHFSISGGGDVPGVPPGCATGNNTFFYPTEKLLVTPDPALYSFINQGELAIDGVNDEEEMRITDVNFAF